MRGQISERGLTDTDIERRARDVVTAMTQDLTEQLPGEASRALHAADRFYRGRQQFIDETLKTFLGSRKNPLPAETAGQRLISMAQGKGNYERFSAMWGELEAADRADIAATIAASLGRRGPDFSAARLVQSLDPTRGINPRTARLVFGEEGARALDDLRVIARAKRDTQQALNNSRTGVAVNEATGGLKTLMASVFGFSQAGPAGAVAGGAAREFISRVGERRAARLLLNPDFTKWLRNAPQTTNPRAIDRYFAKLGSIGTVAANDNTAIRDAIISIASKSPAGAAASPSQDVNSAGEIPPQ